MVRPSSIVAFERLYLGSIAVWAANTAIYWSTTREIMAASPQMVANPQVAGMVAPIMIGSLAVTAGVSVLFWYLVARQAAVAGKWLVVVTEALGALFGLFALLKLVQGRAPNAPSVAIGLVATALAVAATVMLFRPDARAWFGEDDQTPSEPLA